MDRIKWLRLSYWVPAIADFIIAVTILFPDLASTKTYVFPQGLMSAVAVSWGVMLVIAVQQPVQRRWILPPTMLVVFLLGIVSLHAMLTGIVNWYIGLPSVLLSLLVFSLMFFAYRGSQDLE
jgi:hypothetical protein